MQTGSKRWYNKLNPEIIANKAKLPKKEVEMVLEATKEHYEETRRQPKVPAPKGSIGIRAASREYGVRSQTISRWVARGLVPILLRTKNDLYVDRQIVEKICQKYKRAPGRGRRTIFIK